MLKLNVIILTTFIFLTSPQCLLAEIVQDKSEPTLPKNLKIIGQTRFSVWFWDVYDVTLKNTDGIYQKQHYPILMQLDYLRDIKSQELIEETEKQWKRFSINKNQLEQWLAQLQNIWPDVKKGDSIVFFIDINGYGYFFHNQQFIGSIKNTNFSYHFLNIWVAPDGPYPKMTQALTGQD